MRRHPELSLRYLLQIGKEWYVIKPEHIEKWFIDFAKFIEDNVDDPYILKDPSRPYNADSSGLDR